MNASRILTAAALLLVTGCIPAYVSPTRDDAAHLTIVPQTKGNLVVNGFANGKECRNRLNLATSGTLKEKTEIRVTPDEEFTVLALLSYASWDCNIAVSFLPRPREVYTAVIDGDGTRCKLGILHFDGRSFVPEPSERKRSWRKAAFSEDEAQCK